MILRSAVCGLLAGSSASLLVACGGTSVDGEINGEAVPLDDAVFIQDADVYGDDDLIRVFAAGSAGDLCEQLTGLNEQLDQLDLFDEDDAAAVADWWAENLPEEFWQVQLDLRVQDASADLSDATADGVDYPGALTEDDQASASISHILQPWDQDWWLGQELLDTDDYVEVFATDGGDLEVTGHEPGESIRVKFTTTAVELDGDDAGEIEIELSARRCVDIEKYYF